MPINKPFTLMLIFIIALIITPETVLGSYYVGFYEVINWPIISVSIINGTFTENGIVIVISPNTQITQQYGTFLGAGVLGNRYFLISGIIYSNGTIYVLSVTPINVTVNMTNNGFSEASMANTTYGDFDYVVRNGHVYRTGQQYVLSTNVSNTQGNAVSTRAISNTTFISPSGVALSHGANSTIGTAPLMRVLLNASLLATVLLIALLMVMPLIRLNMSDDRECINDVFVKLVRRLGLRDPSLTHRDVGNYLKDRLYVSEYLVDKLINYYEAAIYGNGNVRCEEFKEIIRQVINARVRRS